MGQVSLPYSLANGNLADASEVMANLNAIVNEINGNIESINIKDLNVTTAKLDDGAVTTDKIADANVTTSKIADSAITNAKIADDAIDNSKIADDAVQAENISGLTGTGSINLDNIPDGSTYKRVANVDGSTHLITTNSITNSAITNAKIANDAITNSKVADDAVQAENISGLSGSGSVDTDNIPEGSTNKYFSGKTTDNLPEGSTNKYFSGKTLDNLSDGSAYKRVTGVNSSHKITASSIQFSTGWNYKGFSEGETYILPAGLYTIVVRLGRIYLEVYDTGSSIWRSAEFVSGAVLADGSKVRLTSDTGGSEIQYVKLL